MNKILNLLSIDISSWILEESFQSNNNIIVLHRHKIFLIRAFFLKLLSTVLFWVYIIILLAISKLRIQYILSTIWIIIFILRLLSWILIYQNNFKKRKTIYINNDVNELFNIWWITNYISRWILLSIFLYIDVFLSIVIQIIYSDNIIENIRFYIIEFLLFISIARSTIKSMKILLDFEMDYVIFTNWTVKFVDREWFYKKSIKIYTSNQIQTITVKQMWWIDSLLKIGSIEIHTSNQNTTFWDTILTFWKIDYNHSMEDKFHSIIYENK